MAPGILHAVYIFRKDVRTWRLFFLSRVHYWPRLCKTPVRYIAFISTVGIGLSTIDFYRHPHLCNIKEVASIVSIMPINTTIGVVAIAIFIIIITTMVIVRPLRNFLVRHPGYLFCDLEIRTTPGTPCTPYVHTLINDWRYVRCTVHEVKALPL